MLARERVCSEVDERVHVQRRLGVLPKDQPTHLGEGCEAVGHGGGAVARKLEVKSARVAAVLAARRSTVDRVRARRHSA